MVGVVLMNLIFDRRRVRHIGNVRQRSQGKYLNDIIEEGQIEDTQQPRRD